ncbi:hypothetical protein [Bradyrhizobium sp.]|uniref:hypothetical protein n=1 Tax=Bradyrhizobium sp. TaxID=376 RepID=UPI0025BF7008|nr:hypothetical protein [Bradyrhizobium sp.]
MIFFDRLSSGRAQCARAAKFRTDPGPVQLAEWLRSAALLKGNAGDMTFIIESAKDNRRTTDFRSSAEIALALARKLVADGFAVSITDPSGQVYSADRLDLLLTRESLNSQE